MLSQENQNEDVSFEIEPIVVEENKEEVVLDLEGASNEEKALAEKHGFTKKEVENVKHEEQREPKSENNQGKVDDVEGFEKVEQDEKLLDKYNRNEKALYFKWKADKIKRQNTTKENLELKEQLGLDRIKASVFEKRLEEINALLESGSDDLTIDKFKSILSKKYEPKDLPEPKKEEFKPDDIQNKVATKANYAEKIGMAKYENFQGIATLAKEIAQGDGTGTYQALIDKSFIDDNVDENMLVERIVSIAKLSPKYNEVMKSVKPEEKENVDRMIKNSKKKISSASLSTSENRRVVSHENLTVEDAARLSPADWAKLPSKTKERLLRGIDP